MYKLINPSYISKIITIRERQGEFSPYPSQVSPIIQQGLEQHGIKQLYAHQAAAINSILSGNHTMITTSTASGKSMNYTIPILNTHLTNPNTTSLYLSPAKALGQNQRQTIMNLCEKIKWPGTSPVVSVVDGDTPANQRNKLLNNSNVIITTPDLIHYSMLSKHKDWQKLFANLKYVILDEAHIYRGVLGNNVCHVIRRLRRVCERYGSKPVFILCTATLANPEEFARNLIGEACVIIGNDTSPAGKKHFVFYKNLFMHSNIDETVKVMGKYIKNQYRVIVFGRSRRVVEVIYQKFKEEFPSLYKVVTPYKGSYTADIRRDLEQKLFNNQMQAVISTSALEMGVDIGDLSVCILCGFAGSVSSTWQQVGRVGRKKQDSLVVLIPNEDPLDIFMVNNPRFFFERPCEKAIINPNKIEFLAEHLLAAATELHITQNDYKYWDREALHRALRFLLEMNAIKKNQYGGYSVTEWPKKFGLRGRQENYRVITKEGELLEEYSYDDLLYYSYPGAILTIRGEPFLVDRADLEKKMVFLNDLPRELRDFTTKPEIFSFVVDVQGDKEVKKETFTATTGTFTIVTKLNGYALVDKKGKKYRCELPQKLPSSKLRTTGMWLDVDEINRGALHALEHLLHIVSPWIVMCDRSDLGTFMEPRRIYLYDKYEGGVGLAESVIDSLDDVLQKCADIVFNCQCKDGCPSCIQIPQCPTSNEELDKNGVKQLLARLLGKPVEPEKEMPKIKSQADLRLAARAFKVRNSRINM